mmetsp:Transcript_1283/g.3944  ORF Transcript_1283/g.3944 Transcript_1283/m.3944 type:complete len:223 (+) Transcript_1283:822-1490(+)
MERVFRAIDSGADVNFATDHNSALNLATRMGNFEIMEVLIKHGANLSLGVSSTTPLHTVVQKADRNMIDFLLYCGADVRAREPSIGATPLHIAAQEDHVSVITKLLQCGSRVDDPDDCGRTALHYAAIYGKVRACRRLIDHAANIYLRDNEGDNAIQVALQSPKRRSAGFAEVISTLMQACGSPASVGFTSMSIDAERQRELDAEQIIEECDDNLDTVEENV